MELSLGRLLLGVSVRAHAPPSLVKSDHAELKHAEFLQFPIFVLRLDRLEHSEISFGSLSDERLQHQQTSDRGAGGRR